MIGVSLSAKDLLESGRFEAGLPEKLKALGVESIELRDVKPGTDPLSVKAFARLVWAAGLQLTVHCRAASLETAVTDVFDPLALLLPGLEQKRITVTIHPVVGDNAQMLRQLSDHAAQLPVTIALENNRKLPDGTEGDSTALVLEAVEQADRPNVGICFDLGHYTYYWKKNRPDETMVPPPKAFLRRMVHSHIHGMEGLRTHFPLDEESLPLGQLLKAMSVKYYGVYNLELSFSRFQEQCSAWEGICRSVEVLKANMPYRARLYDGLRRSYDRDFLESCRVFEGNQPGTRLGLMQCACYLFNTGGFCWGMDVGFLDALWQLTGSPYEMETLLKPLQLVILTHGHNDHYSEPSIRALARLAHLRWVVPDFLAERTLSLGVARENMTVISAGQAVTMGPLRIQSFAGRHFRPDTGKGLDCLGYHISAQGAPSLVFPADVRDFRLEGLPQLPPADYCFAHVYLGDGNEFAESFPMAEDFCRFMLHFSHKNVLLTHLYNPERVYGQMWDDRHACVVENKLKELEPGVRVQVPQVGQVLAL